MQTRAPSPSFPSLCSPCSLVCGISVLSHTHWTKCEMWESQHSTVPVSAFTTAAACETGTVTCRQRTDKSPSGRGLSRLSPTPHHWFQGDVRVTPANNAHQSYSLWTSTVLVIMTSCTQCTRAPPPTNHTRGCFLGLKRILDHVTVSPSCAATCQLAALASIPLQDVLFVLLLYIC